MIRKTRRSGIHFVPDKKNRKNNQNGKRRVCRQPMLITLCPTCASQFYNMRDHYIKRVDADQYYKDECCFCGVRRGYDFWVYDNSNHQPSCETAA